MNIVSLVVWAGEGEGGGAGSGLIPAVIGASLTDIFLIFAWISTHDLTN